MEKNNIRDTKRFKFGENWKSFLKHYNKERLDQAVKSLTDLLNMTTLSNKTFIDIGCGSGLFSLAAVKLGAKKVYSFDYDLQCAEACLSLKNTIDSDVDWTVTQGDILNDTFLKTINKADIVYSWGVLPFTGNMWQAIKNCTLLVADKGIFVIGIYNKVEYAGKLRKLRGSWRWYYIKKMYVYSPKFIKSIFEVYFIGLNFIKLCLSLKNPFKYIAEYKKKRGMSWIHDIKDWIGGFPFEFATVEEVFKYCQKLGYELVNIKVGGILDINEFVFRKR